jgi:VanZ family protein
MGVIFTMSTSVGSAAHTSRILEPFLRWLIPSITPEAIYLAHTVVRKGGHLSEYAVLALLTLRAALRSAPAGSAPRFYRSVALAGLVAAAYAATDEFHQSFVPGRTASIYDVGIDTTGAVLALTVVILWRKLRSPTSPAALPNPSR